MIVTLDVRRVIERAPEYARKAEISVPKQIEHAVGTVLQMHPELTEEDAVRAVRRGLRPY